MKILLTALAVLSILAIPAAVSLLSADAEAAAAGPVSAGHDSPSSASAPGEAPAEESRVESWSGTQTIGAAAVAPYPTCPLQCTIGYGFMGSGGLLFEVGEGATRVIVTATWTPSTPLSERLEVGLSRRDDACEHCYFGVAGAEGAREITFEHEAPEPGEHLVSAWPAGRASAAVQQQVQLEVVVHYS